MPKNVLMSVIAAVIVLLVVVLIGVVVFRNSNAPLTTPLESPGDATVTSTPEATTSVSTYTPTTGDIVRTPTNPSLYFVGTDGKRHLYSSDSTFWSWYTGDWNNITFGTTTKTVKVIPQDEFDQLNVGANVTVQPGSRLVRFDNSQIMYAVTGNAQLAKVDEATAQKLFGSKWRDSLIVLPYTLEGDYTKDGKVK
ncbi:MAG: hypothetical protein KBB55_03660 [Candidatus Buchananbacteria bacterium]|nr:hypothetical protein [Candidatus Buchananbacteria bacterium]